MRLLIAALCFTLFLSSCSEEEFHSDSSDYFPLSTGNYWQLGEKMTYEVVKTEELKGKSYYLVSTGYDSTWYRIENERVYAVQGSNKQAGEGVIFDFTANEGDSWTFHEKTVTLQSKKEEISFQSKKVKDCYRFFVDDPRMADEEYWISFAPGIGIIQYRCSFCINPVSTLKKAKINGVEI